MSRLHWTVPLLCTGAPSPSIPEMREKQCGLHRVLIPVHPHTQIQKEWRVVEDQQSDEQMRASRLIQNEMFCVQIKNISIWCSYINVYVHFIWIKSIPVLLHFDCGYCCDLVKLMTLDWVVLLEKLKVNQSSHTLDGAKHCRINLIAHPGDVSLTNTMSACSSRLDSREASINALSVTKYVSNILDCKTEAEEVQRENITYDFLLMWHILPKLLSELV